MKINWFRNFAGELTAALETSEGEWVTSMTWGEVQHSNALEENEV